MIFGSFTVFANDKTPEKIAEERALEKIYELASVLDGKYFTTTQKPCHNNSCNYCYNLNVTSCDWFVDMFGYSVQKKQMAYQYFSHTSVVAPAGWSCFSFSVFAQWYIFSPSNSGTVGNNVSLVASYTQNKNVKFNLETLATHARPGDAIRIKGSGNGGHSVIFVSCDEEGVTVLDSNYLDSNMVALHKIPYTARYGGSAISNRGISITRANNYDTVAAGTSCAAIAEESDINFFEIGCPTVHLKGRSFSLNGRICSGKLIDTVSVRILDAKTEKTVFEYTVSPARRNFTLSGSELDLNTKFGSLKNGVYFLEYTATDVASYTESYRSDCFSVCDEAHYCYFGNGEYSNGKLTYTCTLCGRFEIYEIAPPSVEEPSEEDSSSALPPMFSPGDSAKPPVSVSLVGDLNGNGKTDADDAIYLLYSCFFGGENYPVDVDCDFDVNEKTDANDAIYLLYHVFFGKDTYPISE